MPWQLDAVHPVRGQTSVAGAGLTTGAGVECRAGLRAVTELAAACCRDEAGIGEAGLTAAAVFLGATFDRVAAGA